MNTNLFKAALKAMQGWSEKNVDVDLCLIGGKAAGFFKNFGGNTVAAVRDMGEAPSVSDLIGSVKTMLDAYSEGKIDRLYLVGNEFVNTMDAETLFVRQTVCRWKPNRTTA